MPTASRTRVKRTWRARLAGEEFSRNGERSELSTRCHFPLVGFSEIEMNNQRFPRQEVFSCKRFAWIKFRFAASILTSAVSYRNAGVALVTMKRSSGILETTCGLRASARLPAREGWAAKPQKGGPLARAAMRIRARPGNANWRHE